MRFSANALILLSRLFSFFVNIHCEETHLRHIPGLVVAHVVHVAKSSYFFCFTAFSFHGHLGNCNLFRNRVFPRLLHFIFRRIFIFVSMAKVGLTFPRIENSSQCKNSRLSQKIQEDLLSCLNLGQIVALILASSRPSWTCKEVISAFMSATLILRALKISWNPFSCASLKW